MTNKTALQMFLLSIESQPFDPKTIGLDLNKDFALDVYRTIAVTDSDCIFPIYAYHNRNNDNRAAELFYTRICEHFCK